MNRHAFLVSLLATCLASATAQGQAPPSEAAITRNWQDPSLQWGPCPSFLPEGCALAVLHGDPAKANADVYFKVPGGAAIPNHWHNSAERITAVSGELEVTYEGQPPTVLKPGTYAFGPAKKPHKAKCAAGDPCVLFIAFELPVDAFPVEVAAE